MPPAHPPNPQLTRAALLVVMLGAAVAPLDFALAVGFPAIADDFGLNLRQIRWAAISYVLTYGALMLWLGALGDRVGHLRVFAVGLLLSAGSITACALAPSYGLLLAARVLMGLGVAFTLSCAPALALSLYDDRQRTRVLARYGSLFALAGLLAPLAGGWAMDRLGWPGLFWFRLPVILLALLGLPLLLRARAAARLAASDVVASAGAADSVAALAAAAPGRPCAPMPWWSARLWRVPGFARANAASVALQFASFAVVLVMPFYLVRQGGWSPSAIGLTMACWASGTMLGSALAARWIRARARAQFSRRLGCGTQHAGLDHHRHVAGAAAAGTAGAGHGGAGAGGGCVSGGLCRPGGGRDAQADARRGRQLDHGHAHRWRGPGRIGMA